MAIKYKRVLIKVSGEALAGEDRFGVNAQPNYIILDSEGNPISPVRGYGLDIDGFVSFLDSGLRAFQQK